MPSESPPLYDFYFRYKWSHEDFAGFQDAMVGCVRDAFAAVFGPALIDGGVVAPSGSTRAVTVQPYIAINDSGYLNVQNDITLAAVSANSSGNPRKDLIVARPKLTNGTMISRPTSPFDSVPLTILQETEIVVIPGTPAGSPAYPSKGADDVIIAGLAVANGATSFSSGNIDTSITELISTNSNFSNWVVGKDTHGTAALTADSSATRAALTATGGNNHEGVIATSASSSAPAITASNSHPTASGGAIVATGGATATGAVIEATGADAAVRGTSQVYGVEGITDAGGGIAGIHGKGNGNGGRGATFEASDRAAIYLVPQSAPGAGQKGDLYVGTDGKLYVHNGSAFVVAGSQS